MRQSDKKRLRSSMNSALLSNDFNIALSSIRSCHQKTKILVNLENKLSVTNLSVTFQTPVFEVYVLRNLKYKILYFIIYFSTNGFVIYLI